MTWRKRGGVFAPDVLHASGFAISVEEVLVEGLRVVEVIVSVVVSKDSYDAWGADLRMVLELPAPHAVVAVPVKP